MNTDKRPQLQQVLHSRRHAIAGSWHKAVTKTSYVSFDEAQARQHFATLTEEVIAILLAEPFDHGRAEAIGASLAGLHYIEPQVLGKTQEVLAQQLVAGLSADQVAALQPRLATLLGGVATGFFQQARETILTEQEQIRRALTTELQRAQEALQKAYDEVEQQVQERTAELRAANESLRREITERVRVEEALQESEERFRGIFENATIGLYRTAPDGRILMANPTLVRMLGYSSFDELAQRNLEEGGYEPGYPRSAFRQRIESEGQVIGLESAWVRRDGTTLFIREGARAVCDEAGNTLYYEGTVEDITERRRAEEALQKAHDELEMRVQERTAELAQANEALRLERDLAEALAEAAAVVSSTLDPDQVLDRILEQVSRVVPNDTANVMLIEDGQVHVTRRRGYERFGAEELVSTLVFHPGMPALQQMMESGEPIVIPDTATYPGWVHVPEMEGLRSYAAAPIVVRGEVIGFLNADSATPGFFTPAHAEALRAFADYVAASIKNAQLYEAATRELAERKRAEQELLTYQERLRSLASQLSLAEERERRRIATALHDRIGQTLALSKIKLGALRESASSTDFAGPLDEIRELIEQIVEDTRSLIFEISSPILYQLGLEAAVEWLTEQIQAQHGILSDFEDDGQPKPLDDDIRVFLFQAVRELLVNVVKHAQAHNVKVSMRRESGNVRITIEDDGVGFDTSDTSSYWSRPEGFGLFSIGERLTYLGGHLEVESKPSHRTQVALVVPLRRYETTTEGE